MFTRMFDVFLGTLLIIAIIPDTASYNKYGRTCKDIGCRSDETCILAEDPCTSYSDKCGRYPTCQKINGASCTTMVCGENEYCKNENGVPKCVKKSTGLENEIEIRTVPKREANHQTEAESSNISRNSDRQVYPVKSSGYPSDSGYPNSGYPSSGFSSDSTSTNQPQSNYPSSGSSGYPSNGSPSSSGNPSRLPGLSGYPSSGSSGYPSSGSSGYPSSGSSGYPSSGSSGYPSSGSSGYPSSGSSGYPSSGSSAYPSSGSSGYPSSESSSYPSSGSSVYPSSGYPSRGSSGYPTRSGYPSSNSDSLGYPDNSRNSYNEQTVRRTSINTVNAGYPGYPQSVYPERNPSYRGNYPSQNAGYPSSGYPYNNQRSLYTNQGYSQNYPQGHYPEGYYQGQNYMTTTKRPGFRDQLTNLARNVAERVLTQTLVDRITGRHQ